MFDKKLWSKINVYSKKLKAINYLGSKCEICGEDNYYKLCFHHNIDSNKEYKIGDLKYYRWSKIEKEIKKCKLLCYNCHHELHSVENSENYNRKKSILLEFKNSLSCEKCGYDRNIGSLDFHHTNPNGKEFKLSDIKYTNIESLKINIENELNKCIVLCKNCHMELHYDDGFLKENYNLILDRIKNMKEVQPKINRKKVKKMYMNGMKQIEIARHFNASKGTISGIIKELNLK